MWSPAVASADGFVSPWIGSNFSTDPDDGKRTYGITAGAMGGGIIGGEFDFGYSPNFYGDAGGLGGSNLLNLMGNVVIGIPIGGQRGSGVRPYVTGGVGLIRSSVDGPLEDDTISNSDLGYNLGGGVMGFLGDHVGVRADLRFMRTLNSDLFDADFDPEFGLGDFDFWRLSFGVVFR
jgi:opacity protein-like surface antigen